MGANVMRMHGVTGERGGSIRVRSILRCVMSHCQLLQQSGLRHIRQPGKPCHVVPDHTVSLPSSRWLTGTLCRAHWKVRS